MIRKFVRWFIIFGLSFLISDVFCWTEQGKAFLYLDIGFATLMLLFMIVILILVGIFGDFSGIASGVSVLAVLLFAGTVAITLFATWGATKLFDVDFYVAYQIMTFGQCLCPKSNSKNNDDD